MELKWKEIIDNHTDKELCFQAKRRTMLLIAGFGDDASMFAPLMETQLAGHVTLVPLNLPGFGAPPLEERTTLERLADVVVEAAREHGAELIAAHSIASIIASLAARRDDCPLRLIVSLEGNISPQDAYFSGTAADYDGPDTFRAAFLDRLDDMAREAPIIGRYREVVARADPQALWELGCDARAFSDAHMPGAVLREAAEVIYLYNPDNCPPETLQWLARNPIRHGVLTGATHWKSVDQPEMLSEKILTALA